MSKASDYPDPIIQCSAEESRPNGVDYCVAEAGHQDDHRCHFGHRWPLAAKVPA